MGDIQNGPDTWCSFAPAAVVTRPKKWASTQRGFQVGGPEVVYKTDVAAKTTTENEIHKEKREIPVTLSELQRSRNGTWIARGTWRRRRDDLQQTSASSCCCSTWGASDLR